MRYITERWAGECWDCGNVIFTMFKVRFGIPHDVLEKEYTESTMAMVRGHFEMLECQISNWIELHSENWESKFGEPNAEFYKKICHREIDYLFDEKIDFTKIRRYTWFRRPEDYKKLK